MNEDIYRRQQFGQKTGFGRLPVLLIVDFVNGFTDPAILGGGNIGDAVTATIPLLEFFRAQNLPVAFTRIVYADDGSDCGVWCEKAPRLRELTENAPQSQIVAELAPRRGELIVRKTQASAFFATRSWGSVDGAGRGYGGGGWMYHQRMRSRLRHRCHESQFPAGGGDRLRRRPRARAAWCEHLRHGPEICRPSHRGGNHSDAARAGLISAPRRRSAQASGAGLQHGSRARSPR